MGRQRRVAWPHLLHRVLPAVGEAFDAENAAIGAFAEAFFDLVPAAGH